MALVSGDARREMLIPSPKENLMLMPGYTIPLMDTGPHGILGMLDTEDTDLVFGDAKREMLKANLTPMLGYIIALMDIGHPGTLDTLDMEDTVMDFGGARR